mmetsp:Transcript_27170/g.12669  ORF Transcript_27170/g.12669 Transcript_27170/m.12669 type:complete len:100 (-) Transcript_27170:39-338(-)
MFPLEVRAIAIAMFFSLGTLLGGSIGPVLYGSLIGTEQRSMLFIGYLIASALMYFGALIGGIYGVEAENKILEDVAMPLSIDTSIEDAAKLSLETSIEI